MNCAPDCLARLLSAVTRSLAGMLIGGAGSAWAWTDIASRQAAAIGRMRIRLDKGPLPRMVRAVPALPLRGRTNDAKPTSPATVRRQVPAGEYRDWNRTGGESGNGVAGEVNYGEA